MYVAKSVAARSRAASTSSTTATGRPTTTRGGTAGRVGSLRDARDDVVCQRALVGPVGDGPVRDLPRQPQHERREHGDEERRGGRPGHLEHRGEVEELAVVLEVAGTRDTARSTSTYSRV